MIDFKELQQALEKASRLAFTAITQRAAAGDVYAFALYSDEGALTVCPSTNTISYWKEMAEDDPEEANYYRFSPAEWQFEMEGAEEAFEAISATLLKTVNGLTERQFPAFRDELYATCVAALYALKQEGFFRRTAGRDIFLTFAVSDADPDKTKERDMITLLNDNNYRDEYLAWLESFDD